jgi:chemotaxis protein MotB
MSDDELLERAAAFDIDEGECGGGMPVEEGAPTWTVTFGDMMSLLLTFFILLFSMSELKMDRFLLASQSLRSVMGGTAEAPVDDPMGLMSEPADPELELQNAGPSESPLSGAEAEADFTETLVEAYMRMIEDRLREFIDLNGLQETFEVVRDGDGVFMRMPSQALFASGSAELAPEARGLVRYLGEAIADLEVRAVVSGHADDRPIAGGPFASNWELSAARAAGVADALVARGHDPRLLKVESYGEWRPVADNDTAEGRSRNRRVELLYARADVLSAAIRWAEEAGIGVDARPDTGSAAVEGVPPDGPAAPPGPGDDPGG